jgi:hypothetical protein
MKAEATTYRSPGDAFRSACIRAVQALQADRSECALDDYPGHAKAFLHCRNFIVTLFRDLLFGSLSDASVRFVSIRPIPPDLLPDKVNVQQNPRSIVPVADFE